MLKLTLNAKRINLLFILLFTTIGWVNAQELKLYSRLKAKKKYHEGYIVTSDSIRMNGLIRDYNHKGSVEFVHFNGRTKFFYPWQVEEFAYVGHRFVSGPTSFYEVLWVGEKVSFYTNNTNPAWLLAWSSDGTISLSENNWIDQNFFVKKRMRKFFSQ